MAIALIGAGAAFVLGGLVVAYVLFDAFAQSYGPLARPHGLSKEDWDGTRD